MVLSFVLAAALATGPEPVDLNRYGIFATVQAPTGSTLKAQRDGSVYLELDGKNRVMVDRQRLVYSEYKTMLTASGTALTVDRVEGNGEFTLGWNDLTPGRRTRFHSMDEGRLTCRANGEDVERADRVCKSLRPKRVGEVLRVVAVQGPTLENLGGQWKLTGLIRVEQDGLAVGTARVSINGVELKPSKRQEGALELALDEAKPQMQLKLAYEAGGTRGEVQLSCPGDLRVLQPKDRSMDSPSSVKWTPAPGAARHSVEVATYDEREGVALAGGSLGWASATDAAMSIAVWSKPPFRVTVTAYGPEAKSAQAPFFSCRLVRRVVTGAGD